MRGDGVGGSGGRWRDLARSVYLRKMGGMVSWGCVGGGGGSWQMRRTGGGRVW